MYRDVVERVRESRQREREQTIEAQSVSPIVSSRKRKAAFKSISHRRSIARAGVPPVASFTCSPWNPETGQLMTFDGSSSYDPDGDPIIRYYWDFGDGTGWKKRQSICSSLAHAQPNLSRCLGIVNYSFASSI